MVPAIGAFSIVRAPSTVRGPEEHRMSQRWKVVGIQYLRDVVTLIR